MSEEINLLNPDYPKPIEKIIQKIFYLIGAAVFLILTFVPVTVLWIASNPLRPIWYVKKRYEEPKELNDPQWGKHKFVKVNGIDLHYVEKGNINNPLVIFIHGFPEFWYSWRYQLKDLSKKYWVVALDMRGYGQSSKPKAIDNYLIKNLVADIKSFFETTGKKRFTIVGHDWGGIIAWNFVCVFPELLDGYVLLNTTSMRIWKKLIENDYVQMFKSLYIFFFQFPCVPEFFLRLNDLSVFPQSFKKYASKEDIEVFKYNFRKKDGFTYPLNWYRANVSPKLTFQNNPKSTEVPGLIIWGKADKFLSIKNAYEMQKAMGSNLEIKTIDEAKHSVQQEAPEQVNQYLDQFLSSI